MLLFLKSISFRSVNPQNQVSDHDQDLKNNSCRELATITSTSTSCISLTVWRKSLIFSCKGFTVIGSDGSLVYRVDNYSGGRNQITLMDGSGKPILTVCRHKKLRLVDNNWFIYEGEVGDDNYHSSSSKSSSSRKKPIFCVKKQMKILHSNINVLAHVYYQGMSEKRYSYIIEGSYANRSCKVLDAESRNVVAEIRKKKAVTDGVTFGLEVFVLVVMPGFDSGFAMGMVLLLDQMFS
ncbi:protein LURP-one-related 17-like isoform X2 [Nicotiana tabacum]|uniref:Protein LURP-one-related 17-like isoform X2 n=1 Tax=Nicotiana tabacum TaxID=4097 RepID=A0A1S4AV79_TOBAC|nr:PREDICTED: protein LURP-one-related 17-like isoform X2 [Nicotiana tabacum]